MPVEKYRKCAAKGVTLDGFAFVDFVSWGALRMYVLKKNHGEKEQNEKYMKIPIGNIKWR